MKWISFLIIAFLLGCAQFNGVESESKQGFIPEMILLGSGVNSVITPEQVIEEQAKYYTSSTRALYFQARLANSHNRAIKHSYKRKAVKAREMAMSAEDQVKNMVQ